MHGWYDVTDYDAKGDGQQPDHVAIQAAIDAAAANGGGVVWLPPGTYLLQAGITLLNRFRSSALVGKRTGLKAEGTQGLGFVWRMNAGLPS